MSGGAPGPHAVGVDLGGTKLEIAALSADDEVLVRRRVPTPRGGDPASEFEAIVSAVAELVREVLRELGDPAAPVGVGMPGGVERRTGLVKNSNTTCLNGRPFRAALRERLGLPVAFDNDATCFALAEARLGAAREFAHGVVFGAILGTGVGGGLVLHGKPWSGLHGIAGEWGHHAVFEGRGPLCYCGRRGCLETFASGPAVERAYADASGHHLPLATIAERRAHDPHASAAIDGLLHVFARAVANLIDIVDPSAIVLGGGVGNLGCLYDEGRERAARLVFNDELLTPIVRPALGDSAGVLGAALLARTERHVK